MGIQISTKPLRFVVSSLAVCVGILISSNAKAQGVACPLVFDKPVHKFKHERTMDLAFYIDKMLENQIIGLPEIQKMLSNLEREKIINPIPHERTKFGLYFTKASYQIHYEAIEQIILSGVDKQVLLEWITDKIEMINKTKEKREETRSETHEIYIKPEFNKVKAGEFKMGYDSKFDSRIKSVKVTISKSFEMMSTPVTQYEWTMIMGSNPTKEIDGEYTQIVDVKGTKIKMQPDNPVENVSWTDTQSFIIKINKMSDAGDPLLKEIFPSHKKGDKYRLPTNAEWEYVVTGRGQFPEKYFFGNSQNDLLDYAWVRENSDMTTHPVAQKLPLSFEGLDFYDMFGNVGEWVEDAALPSGTPLPGGVDPIVAGNIKANRLYRGGGASVAAQFIDAREAIPMDPNHPSMGFRLVRE